MCFARRGYIHSTRLPWRSLYTLFVALCLVLTTGVSAQRNQIEITERNVGRFERLVSQADPGTEFILSADAELNSTLAVTTDRITLRGRSSEARPVIRCRTENEVGFRISSDGVRFVALIIRDCRGTAVSVSSVNETDDPLAQPIAGQPMRLEVEFRNVDFVNNTGTQNANAAGALFIGRRVEAEIHGCNFTNNLASVGGAIRSLGTSLQITNSVFRNNTAINSGGAIHGSDAREDRQNQRNQTRLSIRNTHFFGNRVLVGNLDRLELTISSGVPLETSHYLRLPLPSPSGGALHLAYYGSVSITDSEFKGNSAVPAGGAIHLSDNGETEIQNCIFRHNSAEAMTADNANPQDFQLGGALFVAFSEQSSWLVIRHNIFVNNRAVYGGAIHVIAPIAANITLVESVFRRNVASLGGGAIVFRNVNSPEISRCHFVRNSAFVGGATVVMNGAGFEPVGGLVYSLSNFRNNVAYDGGAIFGIGSGTVQILGTTFQRNQAQHHGGALCFIDSIVGGRLILQSIEMHNNTGEKGGAMFLENLHRITFSTGRPEPDRENVVIDKSELVRNEFFGNEAVAGGAIFYRASSLVTNSFRLGHCDFVDNRVHSNLTSLYIEPLDYPRTSQDSSQGFENHRLHQPRTQREESVFDSFLDPLGMDPCYPGGGGAVCLVLSGISQRAPVTVQLTDSLFKNNTADVAGGLFLSTDEEVDWVSRCPPVDAATSTLLTSDPCRSLQLWSLTFINNSARFAGGGIFASNLTHVLYSAASDAVSNARYRPLFTEASRDEFGPNSVQEGGYGPNIASMATRLEFRESSINPNTGLLVGNHSSGQSNYLPPIFLQVVDRLGQVVTAGIQDSDLRVHVSAVLPGYNTQMASGQIDSIAEAGIANFSALALSAPAGVYNVEFLPPRESIMGISGQVELRPCLLGEINKTDDRVCEICLFESFTFDTLQHQCLSCPNHARCRGGASLVPESKYWHSSPFSTIMHECFHNDACSYENRSDYLEDAHFIGRFAFLNRLRRGEDPEFTNQEYPQCSEGYQGPLCGACEEGYGRTDSRTCRKCANKIVTSLVVLGFTIWQLILVGITLRSALVSIKDMNQMMVFVASTSTALAKPIGTTADVRTTGAQGLEHLRDILNNPQNAGMSPEQLHEIHEEFCEQLNTQVDAESNLTSVTQQQNSVESIVAMQQASETIKILVNFLQMTSVTVNINVEWTVTVRQMLTTMKSIAGVSRSTRFAPLSCLFDSNTKDSSIYVEILRFSVYVAIIMFWVVHFSIHWFIMRRRPNSTRDQCMAFFKSRVIICFLVFMLFSYQSLSEEFMGIVSCFRLDSKEINDSSEYPKYSIARDQYWTMDSTIKCFQGKHAFLAGFLGIPGIIFIIFGVPFYLLCFLLYKRAKGKLTDLDVINTYGFIYQNYRNRFVFWEVCILARKALIGVIVVFAYPWGSNLQGLMASGVLIFTLWMHLTANPFKYNILNVFEGCSLLVSIFSFYAGVIFDDENTTNKGRILLSTVLVLINVILGLTLLAFVAYYVDKHATAKLKSFGVQAIPRNFILRFWKLANALSGQTLPSVIDAIRRRLYCSKERDNEDQMASSKQRSDTNQLLASEALTQYSDVIQEGNGQNEITVELSQDLSTQ